MSAPMADRNLLFAIFALQMDFITRDQLVAGMNAWVLEKTSPLGRILMDQGALRPEHRALLEPLVDAYLGQHGDDPQRSLASLESVTSIREALADVADGDVQASLSHLVRSSSTVRVDRDSTTDAVGRPTATGGRFRVLRFHARGGLGEVFVARDEEVRREVALKQIQEQYADDAQSRARFEVEAEVTGRLEHPGIVPVYGLGHYDDGRPYYAMRFIKGHSLKEAIQTFHADQTTLRDASKRSLALRELLRRFLDVCDAMAYAHSRGVLHRDLKPGNIMLGDYGETLVVDWGLAKPMGHREPPASGSADEATIRPESGSQLEPTHGRVGTLAFMPPEQAAKRFDELGTRSDIYSLGATLYCLLTGQPPITEHDPKSALSRIERGEFPRPRALQPWVAPALEAICLKALALKPEDRYDSVRSLALDLKNWLADEPVTARREPWLARCRRWVRKHPALASTAAAIVTVGALAVAVVVYRDAIHRREQANSKANLNRVLDSLSGYESDPLGGEPDPGRSIEDWQRLAYLNDLRQLEELPPALQAESQVQAGLGRVRSGLALTLSSQGQGDEALDLLRKAIADLEDAFARNPQATRVQSSLLTALHRVTRIDPDLDERRRAMARFDAIVAQYPLADPELAAAARRLQAMNYYNVGMQESPDAGVDLLRKARDLVLADAPNERLDFAANKLLLRIESHIAGQEEKQGRTQEALESFLRSNDFARRTLAQKPDDHNAVIDLCMALQLSQIALGKAGQNVRATEIALEVCSVVADALARGGWSDPEILELRKRQVIAQHNLSVQHAHNLSALVQDSREYNAELDRLLAACREVIDLGWALRTTGVTLKDLDYYLALSLFNVYSIRKEAQAPAAELDDLLNRAYQCLPADWGTGPNAAIYQAIHDEYQARRAARP